MSATALLRENPSPSEDEIRKAIQGNICRCTGYVNIVEAIKAVKHDRDGDVDAAARRHAGRDEAGLRRHERPAQGGQAPRPGRGRLLRRHQAARHGLRALRPLAVRAREDRVDRRLEGARARRRLRHAHGRRGRDPHRPVLRAVGQAGRGHQGLRARGRTRAPRGRAGRRGRRVVARARTRRGRARGGRVRAAARADDRGGRAAQRDDPARRRRLERRLVGRLRLGRLRGRSRGGRPRREDRAAALRPLLVDAARVRGRALRVQPRHRAVDDVRQPPDARHRRDLDGARTAHRHRQAALRLAGHRRRVRQQDLPAPAVRRVLPARAQAQPAGAMDRVAHRPAHGERARQRAHVPRDRGSREGGRHAARAEGARARRLRRFPAVRATRLHHLGAGHAGLLPLAEHPRRLHAGLHEQVAGVAEPRLLADAAPLADGARDRPRRARARARPGRGAQAQLRARRGDAVRDAERLRLRLGRLRARARRRARSDRLRRARREARATPSRAASCSASASDRLSTRARTTSASRRCSTRSCSSRATTRSRR